MEFVPWHTFRLYHYISRCVLIQHCSRTEPDLFLKFSPLIKEKYRKINWHIIKVNHINISYYIYNAYPVPQILEVIHINSLKSLQLIFLSLVATFFHIFKEITMLSTRCPLWICTYYVRKYPISLNSLRAYY